MSREEILFDAVTGIQEELVEEAQAYMFRKRRALWPRYAGMAACLALVAAICFSAYQLSHLSMGGSSADNSDLNGAPPPQSTESANQDAGDAPEAMPPEPDGQESFLAVVREVREDCLLVEGTEDGAYITIPTGGLADLPELQEGDMVRIFCAEILFDEEGGAVASGVEEVRLAEP